MPKKLVANVHRLYIGALKPYKLAYRSFDASGEDGFKELVIDGPLEKILEEPSIIACLDAGALSLLDDSESPVQTPVVNPEPLVEPPSETSPAVVETAPEPPAETPVVEEPVESPTDSTESVAVSDSVAEEVVSTPEAPVVEEPVTEKVLPETETVDEVWVSELDALNAMTATEANKHVDELTDVAFLSYVAIHAKKSSVQRNATARLTELSAQ